MNKLAPTPLAPLRVTLAACLMSLSAALPSAAQVPDTLVAEIEAGATTSAALGRCAGLYVSLLEWGGEARLGDDTSNAIRDAVSTLRKAATEIRMNEANEKKRHAETAIDARVRDTADVYLKHFTALYTDQPEGFDQDALLQADATACQQIMGN